MAFSRHGFLDGPGNSVFQHSLRVVQRVLVGLGSLGFASSSLLLLLGRCILPLVRFACLPPLHWAMLSEVYLTLKFYNSIGEMCCYHALIVQLISTCMSPFCCAAVLIAFRSLLMAMLIAQFP